MDNISYFDTHAHFSRASGDYRVSEQVRRAKDSGVSRIIGVGGSDELNEAALSAAREFPDLISIALGFDRDCAGTFGSHDCAGVAASVKKQIEIARTNGVQVSAIGEIGLDYHYSTQNATEQVALFRCQLELARMLVLPVVVHSREADDDTLATLREHADMWHGDPCRIGVLHCYTGDAEFFGKLLELGFYISFSGIVTFRNADSLRNVARGIPDDRLLIETDSPYLTPMPLRGRRNEPAFIEHTAKCLADLRGVSINSLASLTFANASRLFEG